MAKVRMRPFRPVYPTPAGLVVSVAADGKANIVTLGEVYNLSLGSPAIVGISIRKATYSHGLIAAAGEYTVNLPTTALLEQVDRCGTTSGRNVDKFAAYGLTPVPGENVKAPLIAECPVNLECRVIGFQEIGDHDMFQGEVLAAHVEESLLDGEGKLMLDRLDALCFLFQFNAGGQYWSLGRKLADLGFTRGTKPSDFSP